MNNGPDAHTLYVNDRAQLVPHDTLAGTEYELRCERVSPRLMGFWHAAFWNLSLPGQVRAYVVRRGQVVVHRSLVVRGRSKFQFLQDSDIEIGPCWTHPEYRGQGIYPSVLTHIMQTELSEGNAYMIVRDSNRESLRGIAKVGFRSTGRCVRVAALKPYRVQ